MLLPTCKPDVVVEQLHFEPGSLATIGLLTCSCMQLCTLVCFCLPASLTLWWCSVPEECPQEAEDLISWCQVCLRLHLPGLTSASGYATLASCCHTGLLQQSQRRTCVRACMHACMPLLKEMLRQESCPHAT